ncbi:MAG: DUF2938 domain-containing protein [Betaproteobacteria bacterium]|nr:DUF2938 domain-containing protein [Betaproteobacteria bacterium]
MKLVISILITGTVATAIVDLWGIARRTMLGTSLPNYGMVGRWFAHMPRGRLRHSAIANTPSVGGERAIGWVAHYLIGVAFAAMLIGICGSAWIDQPALLPALAIGIATVTAPFLLMQPCMGAGIAASRMPDPSAARRQSLVTHTIFGFGLYAGGWVAHALSAL